MLYQRLWRWHSIDPALCQRPAFTDHRRILKHCLFSVLDAQPKAGWRRAACWGALPLATPPSVVVNKSEQTRTICITFVQCWTNVEDVSLTLYKCYTKCFVFAGIVVLMRSANTHQTRDVDPMLGRRQRRRANINPALGLLLYMLCHGIPDDATHLFFSSRFEPRTAWRQTTDFSFKPRECWFTL